GHCAASEGGPQTGDRRTVSNPGLRFEIADSQAAHRLDRKKIQFIRISAAADPANSFQPVHGVTVLVLVDECGVASLLGPLSNLINRIVPGNIFPFSPTWPPYLWLQQATFIDDILFEGCAFWTKCAAIDWMIGITFDMHDLRNCVFRFVAQRVNDDATTNRAIWTSTSRLRSARYFQTLRLRINRSQAESKHTNARP